jgi:hypothetical protein
VHSGITCASTCTPRTLGLHAGQRLGIPVPGPASSLSLHGQRETTKRQASPPTYGPIARGEGAARLPASSDARERPESRMGRFQLTSELPSRPDGQRACAWPFPYTKPQLLHPQVVSGRFGAFVGPGSAPNDVHRRKRKSQAFECRRCGNRSREPTTKGGSAQMSKRGPHGSDRPYDPFDRTRSGRSRSKSVEVLLEARIHHLVTGTYPQLGQTDDD